MPVRSLSSSVLRWPDARAVRDALRAWAERAAGAHPELCSVGLFGSYARGDWGVGSDADVLIVVDRAQRPFVERARDWDLSPLPVPADVLVYDPAEWEALASRSGRWAAVLRREVSWVWRRERESPRA